MNYWLEYGADAGHAIGMGLGKFDSIDLARYVIAKCKEMNHLKLQKLVYYVEAWHLAYFEEPLIDDEFEAWMHGPVSRKVWDHFKSPESPLYNSIEIGPAETATITGTVQCQLKQEQVELLDDVLEEYGDKSSYHLECLTHAEPPWIDARKGVAVDAASTNRIPKTSIRQHFRALLNEEPPQG